MRTSFVPLLLAASVGCRDAAITKPAAASTAAALAPRSVLALACTHHWASANSGLWSDPANWTPAEVPADTAVACLDAVGDYTVQLERSDDTTSVLVGGLAIAPASGHAILELSGNSLQLNAGQGIEIGTTGEIRIAGADGGGVSLSSGGQIDIAGTIRTERSCPTCGTADAIRGTVVNNGTIDLATNVAFDAANATFTNATGSVSIRSDGELVVGASALTWSGGSLNGDGRLAVRGGQVTIDAGVLGATSAGAPLLQLEGASLTLGATQGDPVLVRMEGGDPGAVTLSGSLAPHTTVLIATRTGVPASEVALVGDVVNAGILTLIAGDAQSLRVSGAGTLTNTGAVVTEGTAGIVHLTVDAVNSGAFALGGELWLDQSGGSFTNSATVGGSGAERVVVQPAAVLVNLPAATIQGTLVEVRGGTLRGAGFIETLQNTSGGTVEPGQGVGTLTVGTFAQDATALLRVEVRGVTSSAEYDRVVVTGAATVDGGVDVVALSPFVGGLCGQIADVVTAGSTSGAFGHVTGGGSANRAWRATTLATAVRLSGYDPTAIVGFSQQPSVLDEGATATAYSACLGAAPNAEVTLTATYATGIEVVPGSATFTGSMWSLPQTLTVVALDDGIFEGAHQGTVTHTAHSADPRYEGITQSFTASINDKQLPAPYTSTLDVVYGSASTVQKLDIHRPLSGSRFPVVLYVHGGTNDKAYVQKIAPIHAVDSGYAVVSINYRKQQNSLLFSLKDVKTAMRFIRNNAAKYNLDPKRLVVWGTSGGAQLSSLVAVTCGNTQFGNGTMKECATGVASWFGVADLSRYADDLAAQSCPPRGRQSDTVTFSPMHYVTSSALLSPMRIENGTIDCVVPYAQAVRLDSALVATGHKSELALYLADHGTATTLWRADSVYSRTIGWIGKAFRNQL